VGRQYLRAAWSASLADMLWERVAGLSLVVDGYGLERLDADGYERSTTQYRLTGDGVEGVGEDVGLFDEGVDALHKAGPYLDLAGEWTLASFVEHLATLDQWKIAPPEWEMARSWRNWAFESAALDLALRQAGKTLPEVLGIESRPVRFVNSLGLGEPPSAAGIARRFAQNPTVGFKLDADAAWNHAIVEELAGLGCVATVDFKGRYGLPVDDEDALVAMYGVVLTAFPEALFEDPHELDAVEAQLEPVRDRLSFDAPIHRVADITTRTINVKPSRIGGLRPLFEIYEFCDANGVAMYGGGMGEVGIGRGQVELLASLFHPDTPNDVAPSAFNAKELTDGLPPSPFVLDGLGPGFRWGYEA
jgi:L-alanine-DL-glutamate epimerase-like enolase superfamily enzyme